MIRFRSYRPFSEKKRRKRFLERAAAFTPYVATVRAEGTFLLPTRGASKLFASPSRTEFIVLARAVETLSAHGLDPRGGTIVDVGANIGTTTITALTSHGFEGAVAVEPDAENARLLQASLALNELQDRVKVVFAAASTGSGTTIFERHRQKRAKHRIGAGRLASPGAGGVSVETISLDDLVGQAVIDPDRTTLLWLDVQGHEGEVLLGARALLERGAPIVFALRPHRLSRPDALAQLLEEQYDTLVDLRRPSLKEGWTPELEPIDALRQRFGERLTTDVLAFRRAN